MTNLAASGSNLISNELPWLAGRVPFGYWKLRKHRLKYLSWLSEKMFHHPLATRDAHWIYGESNSGVSTSPTEKISLEQWYSLRDSNLRGIPGSRGFLACYGDSLPRALCDLLPRHSWKPWLFGAVGHTFWWRLENRVAYIEWLGSVLGIESSEHWYEVSREEVCQMHGAGFLRHYGGSLCNALEHLRPDHPWVAWRFASAKVHYWIELWGNQPRLQVYMKWLAEQLKLPLRSANVGSVGFLGWNEVSGHQLRECRADRLLRVCGGLRVLLDRIDPTLHCGGVRAGKSQRFLARLVRRLFSGAHVLENARPQYLRSLELDVFVPAFSLAFEYQGLHHFSRHTFVDSAFDQKHRDQQKRALCKVHSIDLIEVPYWWDRRIESLIASVRRFRPDLLSHFDPHLLPIPALPPFSRKSR